MLEAEEGNCRMAEKASKRKGGRASKWDKCTCEWESVEGTCFRDKAWLQPMLGSDLLCSKTPSTRALTRARIIIEKISILISRYRSHMSPPFYLKYLHTWPVRTAYLPWLALQLGFRFGLIVTFRFSINNNNVIKIIYISSSFFKKHIKNWKDFKFFLINYWDQAIELIIMSFFSLFTILELSQYLHGW